MEGGCAHNVDCCGGALSAAVALTTRSHGCLQGHPASKGIEGEADMEDPLAAFGVHFAAFISPCFPLPPPAPSYPAPLPERTCCGRATTACRMR